MRPAFRSKRTAGIALAMSLGALYLVAQQPAGIATTPAQSGAQSQAQDQPPTPQLKLSPEKQLQKFEPAIDEEYTLGAGDEISLDFPGRPELSRKYIVGPDGRITLPIAGPLMVANLTRAQASKAIVDALSSDYNNLTVTVNVDKYGSNRVTVLGNVKTPGVFYFDSTPTLLDAVSRGGLQSTPSNKDGLPNRVMIYRGNDQVMEVDLRALLRGGSAMADVRLRRNDIVFVPSQADQFVTVLGEVKTPGAVPLTSESTLPSVLAQAGGLGEGAGRSPNIQIIQKSSGTSRVIPWKQLMTPSGIAEVRLQPGDVVVVPQSGFYKATYFIQRLSPITSLLTVGLLAGGIP
ncbi:MAG: polysaccharide export protein [Silvibacterium sp.]|nr:polysaccharide export protein [Silvibacterium sp.]